MTNVIVSILTNNFDGIMNILVNTSQRIIISSGTALELTCCIC